jgi:hypothetical protein
VSSSVLDHLATAAAALRLAMTDLGTTPLTSGDVVAAARAIVDQAEIMCTRSVTGLNRETCREDGFPNVSDWMLANTSAAPGEGARRAKHAKLPAELPLWGKAASKGTIGYEQIRVLSSVMDRKRFMFARRDETLLLQAALQFNVAEFREIVARWVALCDDEVTAPESDDEAQSERRFQLAQLANGMWHAEGLLDSLTGANLNAALEAAMPKPSPDDLRTITQKRHDALNDIALESLANENRGELGGERHHVTILVEAKTGLAQLEGGMFLSTVTRNMVLCDCVATSIWVSADGEPFQVGTPKSSIPKKTRRAAAARDRGCRFPGCCRPTRWTDIHHFTARADGGTHELRNLGSLCRFHHRYAHRKGLKMYWAADGVTLIVEWPNGVIKHSPPIQNALAG